MWNPEPHSRGKHHILRRYIQAWLPIMSKANPRIIIVDAFAGPGRYLGGRGGVAANLPKPWTRSGADRPRHSPGWNMRLGLPERRITQNELVKIGFSIDDQQELSQADELRIVRLAAELGYDSAWTPAHADAAAFDRCLAWHQVSGLPTGISVVPASGQTAAFYAQHARRVWDGTGGKFVLGVGSGQMVQAARGMRTFMAELQRLLPPELPVYVAALGPRMLRLAAEVADGVALNWCSAARVAWSRVEVERAASQAGRPAPVIAEYIRTAVDPDRAAARKILGQNALRYALGPIAYRQHFERMGFAEELEGLQSAGVEPSPELLSAVGAWGAPGEVRSQFQQLAQDLDVAIVRVLVSRPGDAESARWVLEECRPAE